MDSGLDGMLDMTIDPISCMDLAVPKIDRWSIIHHSSRYQIPLLISSNIWNRMLFWTRQPSPGRPFLKPAQSFRRISSISVPRSLCWRIISSASEQMVELRTFSSAGHGPKLCCSVEQSHRDGVSTSFTSGGVRSSGCCVSERLVGVGAMHDSVLSQLEGEAEDSG